ncbi:hypothetical protein VTL71DRAFT_430 [Oculimacula yallundae]|uniref:Uncharacterized protein n=1 Tax=Oculimacula yallundae TaxID=86028 RepID=A0ABR4D015_9HELO
MRSHSIAPAKFRDIESPKAGSGSFARNFRRARVFITREAFKGRLFLNMSNYESSQGRVTVGENRSRKETSQENRSKNGTTNGTNGTKEKAKMSHNQLDPEHHSDRGMKDMIRIIDSARRSLADAEEMYDQLSQDIQEAVQNRKRVAELETLCNKQQDAIDSILERSGRKDEKLEQKKLAIIEAEKVLEKKKADVDKFKAREEMKAKEAELERGKANEIQLKKQRSSLELEYKELKGKLEKDLKQREESKQKKLTELEAENKRLSGRVKVLETDTKGYVTKLAAAMERYEDMEKLKRLSREEATKSQDELQNMKDEFGLQSNTPEFFSREKFGEVSSLVHTISTTFCQELNSKNAVNLLEDAILGLEEAGENKRGAAVFKSLATRGLRSLSSSPKVSSTCGTRTEALLLAVMPVLRLLAPEAQHTKLEAALSGLVQSAISLWTLVQSDELLDVKASLDLDPALQREWASSVFNIDSGTNNSAVVQSTQPEILKLFPSITAKMSTTSPAVQNHIPGSFDDSKPMTHIQICIHPGSGLPESSALVMRGEQEIREMEEKMEVERLEMNLKATQKAIADRNKLKLQRNGLGSGPPSPTAEWGMAGGLKKSPEE